MFDRALNLPLIYPKRSVPSNRLPPQNACLITLNKNELKTNYTNISEGLSVSAPSRKRSNYSYDTKNYHKTMTPQIFAYSSVQKTHDNAEVFLHFLTDVRYP